MYARLDYAESKRTIIYFASTFTNKVVSFPAFVDGIKLSADFGVTLETESAAQDTPKVIQKGSLFSYSVTLHIPNYSVNESKENFTKLKDLIMSMENPKSPESSADYQSYTYVLLANIIQNGLYKNADDGLRSISTFEQVKEYGAKCVLSALDFKPDLDMGFFEWNGSLLPKAFSLSFNLGFNPAFTYGNSGKYSIMGFDQDADENTSERKHFLSEDTQSWPFGITAFSVSSMNDLLRAKNGSDASELYATSKGGMIGFADTGVKRWVVFEAFLTDFSVKREVTITREANETGGVSVFEVGGGVKETSYTLNFNSVAHSVNEARANLMKIQNLLRFPIKNDGDTDAPIRGGEMYAYFQNFMSKAHSLSFGTQLTCSKIQDYGFLCAIKTIDISLEDEMGFFDYNGFLLPKSFKVSLSLTLTDDSGIDAPLGVNTSYETPLKKPCKKLIWNEESKQYEKNPECTD